MPTAKQLEADRTWVHQPFPVPVKFYIEPQSDDGWCSCRGDEENPPGCSGFSLNFLDKIIDNLLQRQNGHPVTIVFLPKGDNQNKILT